MPETEGVARGYSSSTSGLGASSLDKKALCDTRADPAKGCPHGCEFCYNKASPQYRFDPGDEIADHGFDGSGDWGEYALYREHLPAVIARELAQGTGHTDRWTERGRGVVGLSFGTDPYFDADVARITGITLRLLRDHARPARILTRNPAMAYHAHGDLLSKMADLGLVTIGSSIPTLDADAAAAIEPRAPAPQHRLRGLELFADDGVPVYVSMSPTYPTASLADLDALLDSIGALDPTVVFHEPINPRAGNMADCQQAAAAASLDGLATAFDVLANDRDAWVEYAVQQFRQVQTLGSEKGLPVHLWPDEALLDRVNDDVAEWLDAWRRLQSPEPWPDRPARAPGSMPPLPPAPDVQSRLQEVSHRAE